MLIGLLLLVLLNDEGVVVALDNRLDACALGFHWFCINTYTQNSGGSSDGLQRRRGGWQRACFS